MVACFCKIATENKTIKLMNTFISGTAKLTAFLFSEIREKKLEKVIEVGSNLLKPF